MEKHPSPHTPRESNLAVRAIVLLLSVFLVLSVLTPVAYAAWDGSGNTDDKVSGTISGNFFFQSADVEAITGYRFSVHDGNGEKVGNSVDIHFENDFNSSVKRTYREYKKSHIELYREYLDTGTVDLQKLSTDTSAAAYVLFDKTLPDIPTDVEDWLTPDQADEIRSLCDADDLSASSSYIICEPLFEAYVDGIWYTMTLAEYAVYQSGQYGWGPEKLPSGWTAGTYSAIMRQLSAYFGRFLYATQTYPVFDTQPIPSSALKKDSSGNDSILLGSSKRYNAASDVLKYQMGMAIYTEILPSHELTIDPNGGLYNGSNSVSTALVQTGTQLTIPNPVRAGYAFAGWDVEGSGTLSGTFYTQGNGPCTLTAQWDVLTYTITYDANGGTGAPANQSYTYHSTESITLSSTKPTRTGYTFKGWSRNDPDATTATYSAGGSYRRWNTSCTLYAVWEEIVYKVYYVNGSISDSANVYGPISVKHTATHTLLGQSDIGFTKTGYHISGYNIKISDGNKWRATNNSTGVTDWHDKTTAYSSDYTLVEQAPGYNMKTYHRQSGGTVWLYIVWEPNTYNVKYNANGGTGTMSNSIHTYDTAKALTANAFTRTGYTFAGWNTKADGTGTSYANQASVKNLTSTAGATVNLYAQWEPITYNVKYNANGGTGAPEDIVVSYGSTITINGNPFLRPGYTFVSWNTKLDGTGTSYNPGDSLALTSDIALYAQWELSKYTLTIDMNGGHWTFNETEYISPQSFTIAAGESITIEAPYRLGYTFSGWVISNNTCSLTDGKYLHGTGDCTIVAVWAAHKYPVTALNGYTRFIKYKYLDTLDPNSKWRQKTLYSILEKALKNDLSDISESQQVWHFSSEDYDIVHEWCLNHDKGEQTNKDFLDFLMDPEGLAGKNKIQ